MSQVSINHVHTGIIFLLAFATGGNAFGGIIFLDEFQDESGVNPPTGWVNVPSSAASPSFTEAGGVATMTRSGGLTAAYFSDGLPSFDAQSGDSIKFELKLDSISDAGLSPTAQIVGGGAFGDDFFSMALFGDGTLQMSAVSGGGGQNVVLTDLPSYNGGQVNLTATLLDSTFIIETDVDNYSSGELQYSLSSSGFSRASLGDSAGIRLLTSGTAGSASFDSVAVTAVPEPSSLLLLASSMTWFLTCSRRRRRGQS